MVCSSAVTASSTNAAIHAVWKIERARLIAGLARMVRDLGLAEDLAQDALVAALESWPEAGVPERPGAWLMAVAKRKGLDRLRRRRMRARKHAQIAGEQAIEPFTVPDHEAVLDDEVGDDLLRLIFVACHPLLPFEARTALTLRLLCGLTTPEIARAFLVPEPTVAQRIVRAKRTLAKAGVPFEMPRGAELEARLAAVLEVVYLVFNEGYLASSGDPLGRVDLADEAIRLGRTLVDLMPDDPEARGLLALMLLTQARRPARMDADGELVRLPDQDRGLWDAELVREGQELVRMCLRRGRPGPYQLQAAIAAVHSDAPTARDTDWSQVLALYDQLHAMTPTSIVALNRCVAMAEVRGPQPALEAVDRLDLADYHLFHAVRADLLARLGRTADASAAYAVAARLAPTDAERELLRRHQAELG